ncbi:MAG: peptidoglycan editing factor PgeF [Rhodocyclaceae bacterium]|nr:peptidoglycan editing factor PgeF [Rhodocyclaceae bacterium]
MTFFIVPDWPAPESVRALSTTRCGGHSTGPFAGLNLADHVGDEAATVAANRRWLRETTRLPAEPVWLKQVHGSRCVLIDRDSPAEPADAGAAMLPGRVCAVLTADCLPVLICDAQGTAVAAVHAGWRGLVAGVLENSLAQLTLPGERLLVWLGPAIGSHAFEVGDDVRGAFVGEDAAAEEAFVPLREGKWLCDLYAIARQRLLRLGVEKIYGGGECTLSDPKRFYSFRRDGVTGRMASLIWLEPRV